MCMNINNIPVLMLMGMFNIHCFIHVYGQKGQQLKSATIWAPQPVAGHSLNFIITIVIMIFGWGLFVGLAAESYGWVCLWCLTYLYVWERTKLYIVYMHVKHVAVYTCIDMYNIPLCMFMGITWLYRCL